jgi:predicted ester cyclase
VPEFIPVWSIAGVGGDIRGEIALQYLPPPSAPTETALVWMKGMLAVLPDARYELKSFAVDAERQNVAAYAVFHGTHSGDGGPVPPTGKSASTDYVYVMDFAGGRIRHMTKIWTDGWALRQLGWTS